jgi:phage terminase small subunit
MKRQLTPKQLAFVRAYLECGNACQAYRKAFNAQGMAQPTIEKRSGELLRDRMVAASIEAMRAEANETATLNAAWVLERIMRNVKIAMGEEKVTLTLKPKDKDAAPTTVEISMRDAHAANKGLELLAKHLGLFAPERHDVKVETDAEPVDPVDLARRILHMIDRIGAEAAARTPGERGSPSNRTTTQH